MEKENVVALETRDITRMDAQSATTPAMSNELQNAIDNLIYRLRELGPIETT